MVGLCRDLPTAAGYAVHRADASKQLLHCDAFVVFRMDAATRLWVVGAVDRW